MKNFAQTLKADRERLGWTQEQLAEALGVTQQAIARWEKGISFPRPARRHALLEVLGAQSQMAQSPPRSEFLPAADFPAVAVTPASDMQTKMQERQAIYAALRKSLPVERLGGSLSFGQVKRRYDYVSSHLVANIVRISQSQLLTQHLIAMPVLRLAMAVEPDTGGAPTRPVVLFIVTEIPAGVVRTKLDAALFDASTLHVLVEVVPSLDAIEPQIRQLEELHTTRLKEYDEWCEEMYPEAQEDDNNHAHRPPPPRTFSD